MLDCRHAWLLGAALLAAAAATEDCVEGYGASSRGSQRFASSGAPCFKWPAVQNDTSSALLAVATSSTEARVPTVAAEVSQGIDQVFEPADALPARSEAAAVQPVIGISQRVRLNSKEKKDLGTLGYVMAFSMVVIIIAIGVGIVVGYIYKRSKDLRAQHEQRVYEREMQHITLPLSAFTNQACELVDENTIVVHTNQTPVEEAQNGNAPLIEQAGTPGA